MERRNLNLKAKLESSPSYFTFNTLSSRRFQRGCDRVDLHRPALSSTQAKRSRRSAMHRSKL